MLRSDTRLVVVFLALFALVCGGIWAYDAVYVWPRKTCEARGDWWDAQDRVCAVPMPLTHWTGRSGPASAPKAKHP